MARKKKTEEVVETNGNGEGNGHSILPTKAAEEFTLEGPCYPDGHMHFGPRDLLVYELTQHKVANALQAMGMKKLELEKSRLEWEQRNRQLSGELVTLSAIARQYEDALKRLQEKLEATYGVQLAQVAYDDVSGKINVLGRPVPQPTAS